MGWGGDQMRFWRGEERMLRMKRWGEMEGRAKIKTFRKVGARVCSFCLCIFSSLHLLVFASSRLCIFSSLISQFSSLISHFFTSLSTQNHPYPHSTPLPSQISASTHSGNMGTQPQKPAHLKSQDSPLRPDW